MRTDISHLGRHWGMVKLLYLPLALPRASLLTSPNCVFRKRHNNDISVFVQIIQYSSSWTGEQISIFTLIVKSNYVVSHFTTLLYKRH